MKTLLQKAKNTKDKRVRYAYTEEDLELVSAWLRGVVTPTQICAVKGDMNVKKQSYLRYCARVLKHFSDRILIKE